MLDGREWNFRECPRDFIAPWVDPPNTLEVLKEMRKYLAGTISHESYLALRKNLAAVIQTEEDRAKHDA